MNDKSYELKRNSIGPMQLVCFVIAAAGPLAATVGASPAAFSFGNGLGVPAVYAFVGLMYLVFSIGFMAMSRHVKSAGAFYSYVALGLGNASGLGAAFVAVVTYTTVQCAIYGLFGLMLEEMVSGPLGIEVSWWVYSLAALFLVHLCGSRNIDFNAKLLLVLMVGEVASLLLFDLVALLSADGHGEVVREVASLSNIFSPGLGITIIFAVTCFLGFEATAIYAEEVRNPEVNIPKATYISVIVIALVYTLSTASLVLGYGVDNVVDAAKNAPASFVFDINTAYVGEFSTRVMSVLLVTSLFAALLSFHNALVRYYHALAKAGVLPKKLAEVNPVHRIPTNAGALQSITALLLVGSFAVLQQDPFAVLYSWMSTVSTIGLLFVQLLVMLAVISYFLKNQQRVSIRRGLLAPGVAALCLLACLVLVIANLNLLSGSESWVAYSFPVLIAISWAAGYQLARSGVRLPEQEMSV